MLIYLRLNSRHSVHLKRARHCSFNIPYAFSVTTLAPHNLLLKYFCCLSMVFPLYDLMSQENLGKALSPIITLHKKWSFPLRISSVNVTKTSFFVHWYVENKNTKHAHFKISSRNEVFSRLFSLFFIPGGIFISAFLTGMSSSRNEVSSLQKRVNSTRHFTIDGDDFVLGRV